jgi:hypothetical protein
MADATGPITYWVDELYEKHECGPYGDYSEPGRTALELDGRPITLVSPHSVDPTQILSMTAAGDGELLYLVARKASSHGITPHIGILMVAHRREPDLYSVVVWHELYGWALKYRGLEEVGSG